MIRQVSQHLDFRFHPFTFYVFVRFKLFLLPGLSVRLYMSSCIYFRKRREDNRYRVLGTAVREQNKGRGKGQRQSINYRTTADFENAGVAIVIIYKRHDRESIERS